jgi:outer membrane protein TolC
MKQGLGMMIGKTGETAGRMKSRWVALVGPALTTVIVAASAARADTLDGALVNAYRNNSQHNAQQLLNAATAYMDLLRDGALLELQRRNVEVLQEQLRQTRDRFNIGEVTRTDIAQTEAQLAQGRTTELSAESQYARSRAYYHQFIGIEPCTLEPGYPVDRLTPETLVHAIKSARARHPRDQVQAGVQTAWGQLETAKAQILSTQAQVAASEIALSGIHEESRTGQRTTRDILFAQQQLVNARTALVTAQHDRVVASFTLLSAVGDLSLRTLGLNARTRVETRQKCVTPEPEEEQRGGLLPPYARMELY